MSLLGSWDWHFWNAVLEVRSGAFFLFVHGHFTQSLCKQNYTNTQNVHDHEDWFDQAPNRGTNSRETCSFFNYSCIREYWVGILFILLLIKGVFIFFIFLSRLYCMFPVSNTIYKGNKTSWFWFQFWNFFPFVPEALVSWTLQKVITESPDKIYQMNLLFHVLLGSVMFWSPNVVNQFVKESPKTGHRREMHNIYSMYIKWREVNIFLSFYFVRLLRVCPRL